MFQQRHHKENFYQSAPEHKAVCYEVHTNKKLWI